MRPPAGRSMGDSGVCYTHPPGNKVLTRCDSTGTMCNQAAAQATLGPGAWRPHGPGRTAATPGPVRTAATPGPGRTAATPRPGVSVLAAVHEPGRAELQPGPAAAELGVVALKPGRAEIVAGSAELELGGVELEVGDGELEGGRGGVPAAPACHRGGERAGPGLGGRDPVGGDEDEPAGGVDLAGIAGLAVGHDGGDLQGHGEHVGLQVVVLDARVESDGGAAHDDGGDLVVAGEALAREVTDFDAQLHGGAVEAGEWGRQAENAARFVFSEVHGTFVPVCWGGVRGRVCRVSGLHGSAGLAAGNLHGGPPAGATA